LDSSNETDSIFDSKFEVETYKLPLVSVLSILLLLTSIIEFDDNLLFFTVSHTNKEDFITQNEIIIITVVTISTVFITVQLLLRFIDF